MYCLVVLPIRASEKGFGKMGLIVFADLYLRRSNQLEVETEEIKLVATSTIPSFLVIVLEIIVLYFFI